MPMIDVYAPIDPLPPASDRRIGEELTRAVLRAEGVSAPGPFHLENTAAFIHRMDPATVHTAAKAAARVIRVQIITPPGALTSAVIPSGLARDLFRALRIRTVRLRSFAFGSG